MMCGILKALHGNNSRLVLRQGQFLNFIAKNQYDYHQLPSQY